jgi:hypothetical protein
MLRTQRKKANKKNLGQNGQKHRPAGVMVPLAGCILQPKFVEFLPTLSFETP